MNAPIETDSWARLARTLMQGAACLLLLLGLLGSAAVLISRTAVAAERWFLLEFADGKPPCTDVREGSRCIGTAPKTTVFEMRDGERIEMPDRAELPPAWAVLEQMWVYAPAVTGQHGRRSIELTATPMGARLLISDGDQHYLQSIPLTRWMALEAPNQPKLWVRVSPYSP